MADGCWEKKGTMKCGVCLAVYYCSMECKDKDHLKHQQVCKKAEEQRNTTMSKPKQNFEWYSARYTLRMNWNNPWIQR